MKIRTDFVSNSSSTSFVIRLDKNLPAVFEEYVKKNRHVKNWKWYQSILQQQIQDVLVDMYYENMPVHQMSDATYWDYVKSKTLSKVRFIPDKTFIETFVSASSNRMMSSLQFPESTKDDVNDFIQVLPYAVLTSRDDFTEFIHKSYTIDYSNYDLLTRFAFNIDEYLEKKYFTPKLKKLAKNIHNLLSKKCSNWKFVHAVIDDCDYNENGECKEDLAWVAIEKKEVWGYGSSMH